MVHPCSVPGCRNKAKDGIFRFPKEAGLRLAWVDSLGVDPSTVSNEARVCGAHFKEDDFQRDLKGELLGIPTKRKTLREDAVPTIEKNEPSSGSTRGYRPRSKSYKKALPLPYPSTSGSKTQQSRRFTLQTTPQTKKFQREKEEILQRLKQEAAMNVMRDKLSSASNFEMLEEEDEDDPDSKFNVPGVPNLPGFQPHQCVILQPVGTGDMTQGETGGPRGSDVPVIIPGDPRHIRKTLLKDKKVQEFIESQVAENRDAVAATDASAIVLNTFSKQTDLEKSRLAVHKVPITDIQKRYLEDAAQFQQPESNSDQIHVKSEPEFCHSIFDA